MIKSEEQKTSEILLLKKELEVGDKVLNELLTSLNEKLDEVGEKMDILTYEKFGNDADNPECFRKIFAWEDTDAEFLKLNKEKIMYFRLRSSVLYNLEQIHTLQRFAAFLFRDFRK